MLLKRNGGHRFIKRRKVEARISGGFGGGALKIP
jgi:hypothetical protein